MTAAASSFPRRDKARTHASVRGSKPAEMRNAPLSGGQLNEPVARQDHQSRAQNGQIWIIELISEIGLTSHRCSTLSERPVLNSPHCFRKTPLEWIQLLGILSWLGAWHSKTLFSRPREQSRGGRGPLIQFGTHGEWRQYACWYMCICMFMYAPTGFQTISAQ